MFFALYLKMSKEIVPIKKTTDLEVSITGQNRYDFAWSSESNNLNSSIQILEEGRNLKRKSAIIYIT